MLDDFRQDLFYAARTLRHQPRLTLLAVFTLALGIGANTAIFSLMRSTLLRPLPYPDAGRLVFVWSTHPSGNSEPLTPGRLIDLREQLRSVEAVAGISQISLNLTGQGAPERVSASSVSSSFFDVLGVRPLLGDTFHAGHADPDSVVLSHALWTTRFGGDLSIVGKQISLGGRPRTVVAVMPDVFRWPAVTARPSYVAGPQLWIPGAARDIPRTPSERMDDDPASLRDAAFLRGVARLKPGVTLAQAQGEADAVAAAMAAQHPVSDRGRGVRLTPMRAQFFAPVRRPLLLLSGAVAVVLAMACANVACLLLGRATARRQEIAVRLAIGASRARIVRQLITESLVLAAAGAACGLAIAWWVQAATVALGAGDVLLVTRPRLEPVVLLFACGAAAVSALVFGLLPAWQAVRDSPLADLGDGGTRSSSGPRSARTREALAAAQIGVALVLLVGSVLLLRSFAAASRVDTGIDTRHLLTFNVSLSRDRADSQPLQTAFYDEALARIRVLPGVRSAAGTATLPIGGDDFGAPFTFEGMPVPPPGQEASAGWQIVTPGYLQAMGIPLLSGRDFRESDTRDATLVALVNETFARRHWPAGDPVGRRLRLGREGNAWITVIGVVADVRHHGPEAPPRPEVYQPHLQRSFPFMAFVVRTEGEPLGMAAPVRAAIAGLDPAQPISNVATMDAHVERALSRPRLLSTLVSAFGALALILSLVGVYGAMSSAVADRTREIAIRMALGARREDVLQMVLTRATALAAGGVAGGMAAAFALAGVLEGLLFGIDTHDGPTFVAVAAGLMLAGVLAAALPALRASRISGAAALRS